VAIGTGIYGMIAGLNVGMLVSIVIGAFLIDVKLCRPKREHFQSILRFSKYSFGNAIGGYLYEWVDIIVIGIFLTQEHVGIYGVCWIISAGFLLPSYSVAYSIFPRISKLSKEGSDEKISKIFQDGLVYSSVLIVPAMVGALIISKDFLGIVYGESFREGYLVLIVLMLARVFQSLQMVSERVIEGMDRPDIVFNIKVITAFVNVLGTLALVYWLGFVGAAIATALTMGISFLFNTRRVLEILEVRFPYREFSRVLISAVVMGVVVWSINKVEIFDVTLNLILAIIAGAIVYLVVLSYTSKKIRNKIFKLFM
jgi:O-antigen/teichoic acid export membrane protein